jgi:histidine triad (HIT) family protein
MSSIFSKIVKGEIPCYKIKESENCLAFLDVNPLQKGHTLVIPKKEVDYIFDIESELYKELWDLAKTVSQGIKQVVPCTKIGVAVVGLEVPHAHIHLIPIDSVADMNFARPKVSFTKDEFEQVAKQIREALK